MVRVGVSVLIEKDGKYLIGKRLSKHAYGTHAFPGGHLEMGEEFKECAIREVKEETNLDIKKEDLNFFNITNDIFSEDKHYITIFMITHRFEGELKNMEPNKCEKWEWRTIHNLPEPLMLPIINLLKKY